MAKNRVMEAKNAKVKKYIIAQRKEHGAISAILDGMRGEGVVPRDNKELFDMHKYAQNMHILSQYEMLLATNN